MRPPTAKLIVRLLNWFALVIVVALIVTAVFYFSKPVSPEGQVCTFDHFDCESNVNLLTAFGCLLYAGVVGLVYSAIRLAIWLLSRPHKA